MIDQKQADPNSPNGNPGECVREEQTARGLRPPPIPMKFARTPAPRFGNVFRGLARLGLLLPVVGMGWVLVGHVLLALGIPGAGFFGFLAIPFFAAGFLAGAVGLCGVGRHGRRGILWPALIAVIISIPLTLFGLANGFFTLLQSALQMSSAHLVPSAHVESARRFTDPHLAFSLDLPQGFEPCPEAKQKAGADYGFIRRSADGRTATLITVESLKRLLLKTEGWKPLPGNQMTRRSWRGLDIPVLVSTEGEGEATSHVYQCYVPLRPEGIRLALGQSGPGADREQLAGLVDSVLASLDGDTNW